MITINRSKSSTFKSKLFSVVFITNCVTTRYIRCRLLKMESENSVFTHACVRFCIDKCYYTTELANCRNLETPQHEKDFDESKCYDVQWDDGLFYKAQICLLGSKYSDILLKLNFRIRCIVKVFSRSGNCSNVTYNFTVCNLMLYFRKLGRRRY